MSKDLLVMDIDEINKLPKAERYKAIAAYRIWLKKQRTQDKKDHKKIVDKIYNFKVMKDPIKFARIKESKRKSHKKYMQKLKSDPEKHEQYLIKQRKYYNEHKRKNE